MNQNTMFDNIYVSNNSIYSMDQKITNCNANHIVIGGTGSGKTTSIVEPMLLHAQKQSFIVPVSKKVLATQYAPYLKKQGYRVQIIDLVHPLESTFGFDCISSLNTENDIISFAMTLIDVDRENKHADPYWRETAISVLSAEISLVKQIKQKKEITMKDVLDFHDDVEIMDFKGITKTNMDVLFKEVEQKNPDSIAIRGWKQLINNPYKTASNIFTMVHNCLDKVFTKELVALSEKKKKVDITNLGNRKTVLFIITSPVSSSIQKYMNMMYTMFFKQLFEYAQEQPNYQLKIPVHIIADDGANSPIPLLEDYISIFRAINLSITLCFQSEEQLNTLYNPDGAAIILDNCDTRIYARTMNWKTLNIISKRVNKPLEYVQTIPYDHFVIMRMGELPKIEPRYLTYEDPLYQEMLACYKEKLKEDEESLTLDFD